ncbi:DUF1642 domain-containing protein [Streptococcus chosunense]|jgi:hypothetical protein
MNKQEALKQIEEQRDMILDLHGWAAFGDIKGIINQLDEPPKIELPKAEFKKSPKITIPQFVAEKIEYFKKSGDWDLFQAMDYMFGEKEIKEWLEDKDNQETFALAWISGYEVEKEKRYTVRIKGVVEDSAYLKRQLQNNRWYYGSLTECSLFSPYHTKKELEGAGFGWIFSCEGIEIEEVE